MKKIFSILFLLAIISCNSVFEEEDNKYLVIDNQQEKIDIVNGIYSLLAKVHNEDYFQALLRSDDVNYYFHYEAPDVYIMGSDQTDIFKVTNTIYKKLYLLIINTNNLLSKLSDTEDTTIKGELYFLRAYAYFKLARLFGNPPIVKDADVNFMIVKPEYKEVYEFIEKDLNKALELLPDSYLQARIPGETPHKGVAKALLAEVYLSWAGFPVCDIKKYAEAARLSGEVIQQAEYYNMGLLDDISDLWKVRYRHNQENIFGLFFNPEMENKFIYPLPETTNKINAGAPTSFAASASVFGNIPYLKYIPEFKFYYNFPLNYRKKCFFATSFNLDPTKNIYEYLSHTFYSKWHDRDYTTQKYSWGPYSTCSATTLYLLRYAQTLLTYAEATARSGKMDESAYEAVNMVRRRANHLEIHTPSKFDLAKNLTTEQFLDAVVWERAWELSFEPDGRWFDIIRLNLKDKLTEYRFPNDLPNEVLPQYLTDDWYFYKIPAEDRIINPNLEN